ncbi:hypothetical protein [Niabella ginsengisoli]|uniref:Tetratricopeptide repeat protein n=1 Tax=Niabella ginsengisoli TaxID=522298 RepID=A0ABS9SMW4_9BACT|nr:hypothetical protein [Niabella ginsengisoli]MCH5599621.1 hypothetical protein [Niabella ginsengisoli]
MATLWNGIAIGNIGKTYTNESNFSKAQPLLSQYLQQSISVGDSLNIAMSQNAFASFYIQQKEYAPAYAAAGYALSIAKRQSIYAEIIHATNILAQYHQKYNHADSAVYYHKLSNEYQNLLKDSARKSELSVIKAQIAFDNLQYFLTRH